MEPRDGTMHSKRGHHPPWAALRASCGLSRCPVAGEMDWVALGGLWGRPAGCAAWAPAALKRGDWELLGPTCWRPATSYNLPGGQMQCGKQAQAPQSAGLVTCNGTAGRPAGLVEREELSAHLFQPTDCVRLAGGQDEGDSAGQVRACGLAAWGCGRTAHHPGQTL